MKNYEEMQRLVNSIDCGCKSQVACARSRATLLLIKKLCDGLRKDFQAQANILKESRKKPVLSEFSELVSEASEKYSGSQSDSSDNGEQKKSKTVKKSAKVLKAEKLLSDEMLKLEQKAPLDEKLNEKLIEKLNEKLNMNLEQPALLEMKHEGSIVMEKTAKRNRKAKA